MASPKNDGYRDALEQERTHLHEQLDDLAEDSSAAMSFDDGFADSAQVAAEKGENRALSASLRDQLDDVERALSKLESGAYGVCETCGDPIGEARLDAMPATRFCIQHA